MVEFLTTSGLSSSIEKVIRTARSKITIVSPYIQIRRNYHERLLEAESKNVRVSIIFGKENLPEDQDELLADFNKLNLFFCDNLHAKCFLNEDIAILGSMNLYEYPENNNREMGVLIEREKEPKVYDDINNEVESIIKASARFYKTYYSDKKRRNEENGNCIRCGREIELNPDAPYCRECFREWNIYRNIRYKENFCHICGKEEKTSMEKPMCYKCFCGY